MPELRFRLYFDGDPATAEDLAHIEEITVDQTEDAAWEARLIMSLCLDEQGNWDRQDDIRLRPRTQVRVELKIGTDDFQPLIEGPIVGVDTAMDSRPGRSTATVVVHDDSAWLNLRSGPIAIPGRSDSEIARELFTTRSEGHVTTADIVIPEEAAPPVLGADFAQLGTPMQMLRHLAERNGCRAFVLPGPTPGQSIGCLKADPAEPGTLPDLVLLGSGRNLADVTVAEDPDSSRHTTVHTLSLSDQGLSSYTTQQSDEALLGEEPAAPEPAESVAPPGGNASEDAAGRARARARRGNFPVRYTGRTIACAYPKILQPYQKVALRLGAARTSTHILITRVNHRITPSLYSVEFEARGNSFSAVQRSVPGIPAGIV